MTRFQITGNGIVDLQLNEVIAVRPGRFSDPQGHDDFQDNSTRITALLNSFHDWKTEDIVAFAANVPMRSPRPMQLPVEAHVEFSDDKPQFQPVAVRVVIDPAAPPSVTRCTDSFACTGQPPCRGCEDCTADVLGQSLPHEALTGQTSPAYLFNACCDCERCAAVRMRNLRGLLGA